MTECPICYGIVEKKIDLLCNHVVCTKCFMTYVFEHRGKTCPMCRADFYSPTVLPEPIVERHRPIRQHHHQFDHLFSQIIRLHRQQERQRHRRTFQVVETRVCQRRHYNQHNRSSITI